MRTFVALCVVLVFAASASADLFDDFDSYADQAAFEAAYPPVYAGTSMTLDQAFGYSDSQSVHGIAPSSYSTKNYRNLGAEYAGTDEQPLIFEFMMYFDESASGSPWNARNYCELRGYTGEGYGDGDLEALIAIGLYNATADSSKYQARVLFGGLNWFDTTIDRMPETWTKMTVKIMTDTVEVYVDDVLGGTSSRTAGVTYDSIVIGSGLTSADVDAWFDDMSVYNIPEPATLSLLLLGGLALMRRR